MKKHLKKILVLTLAAVLVLGGCAKKGDDNGTTAAPAEESTGSAVLETMEPSAKIDDITEYVKLGQYMGLEAPMGSDELTQEEIDETIKYACEQFAENEKITEGTVKEGDTVDIHYVGKMDGEEFQGGTGDYQLKIGSNSFIDGFESGLIGAEVGSTIDLNLNFPDPYQNNTALSGKPVVFTVTINHIVGEKIVPEFDDALAVKMGYKNQQEMYDDMMKNMQESKTNTVKNAFQTIVWSKAVENAEILKKHDGIYDYYYKNYVLQYENMAAQYGMALDQLLMLSGSTTEEFTKMAEEYATACMEQELVCRAIVVAEGLTVSEEKYQETLKNFYTQYTSSFADEAALEAYYGRERLENDILWSEIIKRVGESGIPVEETETEGETTESENAENESAENESVEESSEEETTEESGESAAE